MILQDLYRQRWLPDREVINLVSQRHQHPPHDRSAGWPLLAIDLSNFLESIGFRSLRNSKFVLLTYIASSMTLERAAGVKFKNIEFDHKGP